VTGGTAAQWTRVSGGGDGALTARSAALCCVCVYAYQVRVRHSSLACCPVRWVPPWWWGGGVVEGSGGVAVGAALRGGIGRSGWSTV